VKDGSGQALAYVYFEDEPGRHAAAKLAAESGLTKDEARRIAFNILPNQALRATSPRSIGLPMMSAARTFAATAVARSLKPGSFSCSAGHSCPFMRCASRRLTFVASQAPARSHSTPSPAATSPSLTGLHRASVARSSCSTRCSRSVNAAEAT
jgi:hypothetical protein